VESVKLSHTRKIVRAFILCLRFYFLLSFLDFKNAKFMRFISVLPIGLRTLLFKQKYKEGVSYIYIYIYGSNDSRK
jgi:hypothetical protein